MPFLLLPHHQVHFFLYHHPSIPGVWIHYYTIAKVRTQPLFLADKRIDLRRIEIFFTGNFLNLWTIWVAFLSWGCSDLFIIKIYKRPMLGSRPSFNTNIEICRTFTWNGILPCDCETWIKTDILLCIINNLEVQRNFVKKWTSKTTFFNNQPRRNIN